MIKDAFYAPATKRLSIVTDEEVKKTLNNEYMNIMNELKQLKEKNSK